MKGRGSIRYPLSAPAPVKLKHSLGNYLAWEDAIRYTLITVVLIPS